MRPVEITYRYDDNNASLRPRPSTADDAVLRLNDGSKAFAALLDSVPEDDSPVRRMVQFDPRDLGLLQSEGAPSQRPFAAVLGCSDARAPLELIFSEGMERPVRHPGGWQRPRLRRAGQLEIRGRASGRQPQTRCRPRT